MSIITVVNNIFQITLMVIIYNVLIASVQAQVVPDATLPNNSIVTSEYQNIIITGGTYSGANLFHSFSQFSVRDGESVYFNNAGTVNNIIMRVTGRDISTINGLIRTTGNLNFYLLNPNGIYFGKHAALDIKGSLHLSAAKSWQFPDNNPPLLNISAPIGVQWGRAAGNMQIDADFSVDNLNLTANNVTITGNLTSTGNITVVASNKLTITGAKTGLFTDTFPNSTTNGGNKGNIYIQAPTVEINDKARVDISSQGSSKSGDLQLVTDKLTIEGGKLSAKTNGEGGNLNVYVSGLLTLRENATISTISRGKNNSANINIQAGFILVNPDGNNDITTNVIENSGGKIKISSNAIFGLEKRSSLTRRSDISVTSPANTENTINITTLNIDPNRGVTRLPTSIVDVSKQINQTCSNRATANRFIIVGRGGLPLNPTEALNVNSGWIDWRHVDKIENNKKTEVTKQSQPVEATAWEIESGSIKLVATHQTSPIVPKTDCQQ